MIEMSSIEIEQLLGSALIGRLCMSDERGAPYAIPLPFCWSEGGLYLRLPLTGRKGRVLLANDRVCFEVDDFTAALDHYASVLIEGRLVEVIDLPEKLRVKALTDEKYHRLRGGHRPGHGRSTPIEQLPLRKIRVERIAGRKKEDASVPRPEGAGVNQ